MKCADLRRYLGLYLDSELSPETTADLLRHVETCSACAATLHAEQNLEQRIRASLRKPQPGDDEAWQGAVAGLPRSGRRWRPVAAGAAVIAIAATVLVWNARHRELDLAAELARHHVKYVGGHAPLGVETKDLAVASGYLRDNLDFACEPRSALPAGLQLVGARRCYLEGSPAAFYFFHRGAAVVTVAVCPLSDLARFPVAAERLNREGQVHCRVDGMEFVVIRDSERAVTAVGAIDPAELAAIARAFASR
jgi:anti-sigma factor RsiW